MSRRSPGDGGSMSVLAAGLLGAVTLVLAGGLAVASAVEAAHRARSGADLAVLAAAARWQIGAGVAEACGQAGAVAKANGSRLTACRPEGDGSVWAAVSAPVRWQFPGTGYDTARAEARAGPGP